MDRETRRAIRKLKSLGYGVKRISQSKLPPAQQAGEPFFEVTTSGMRVPNYHDELRLFDCDKLVSLANKQPAIHQQPMFV